MFMKKTTVIKTPILHLLVISLLGLLVYSNTFDVPFQFDDNMFIVDNPYIKDFGYFIDQSQIDDLTLNTDGIFQDKVCELTDPLG
jgi:hypothetical protein